MSLHKIYKCCICHKILDTKPIRLAKQVYGAGKYNQYYTVEHFDICKKCYRPFIKWIEKYKEIKNEN